QRAQLRVLRVPLSLLDLDLRLDDIGTRDLAALLLPLRDLEELPRLGEALLRGGRFADRRHDGVKILDDGRDEAARRHVGLGARLRERRLQRQRRQGLVWSALTLSREAGPRRENQDEEGSRGDAGAAHCVGYWDFVPVVPLIW